jgi:hypothetical protein
LKLRRHLIAISLTVACAAALAMGARAQSVVQQPFTNQDIIRLVKEEKLNAQQLKTKIGGAASRFDLSEAGLKQLQDAGVDASVLAVMIQSPAYKGDWHVADLYDYVDSQIQLSGTNYVPSLFSPLAPGLVYLLMLALLWLALAWWADEARRSHVKILAAVMVVVLLASGALIGSTSLLGRSYSAVAVAEVDVTFLKRPISPDQDPCSQIMRRPSLSALTSTSLAQNAASVAGSVITGQQQLDPLSKPTAMRESDAVPPKLGVQQTQTQASGATQRCRQPETSVTPQPTPVGKVISPEGSTGDVYLNQKGVGYVLTVSNVRRAGKYTGRVSSDIVAPAALPVTLNVSDWWPYFFLAVALGIALSNYSFKARARPSLPHNESSGANREAAEAFGQGLNSMPVTTVSSLAAALLGLYASYSGVWGLPVDYVAAFLGGAAITLGLRTLAGAANAAATRLERALKKEPTHFVNEVHLPPPADKG